MNQEDKILSRREKSTKAEQNVRIEVLTMCWSYLQMNFHKMTEQNKIKIAMTLCAKNIPNEITGQLDTNLILGAIHQTVQKAGND